MENADVVLQAVKDGAYINMRNDVGWTALMLATVQQRIDVVQELLDLGADCNRSENDGWTALHFAAAANAEEIVALLLRFNVNPHLRNSQNKTAKDIAKDNHFLGVIDLIPDEPPQEL